MADYIREVLLINTCKTEMQFISYRFSKLYIKITTIDCIEIAIQYLNDPQNNIPDLIIIDAMTLHIWGNPFTADILFNDIFKNIPIIVMINYPGEENNLAGYELPDFSFVDRRILFSHFFDVVRDIERQWLDFTKKYERDSFYSDVHTVRL